MYVLTTMLLCYETVKRGLKVKFISIEHKQGERREGGRGRRHHRAQRCLDRKQNRRNESKTKTNIGRKYKKERTMRYQEDRQLHRQKESYKREREIEAERKRARKRDRKRVRQLAKYRKREIEKDRDRKIQKGSQKES